LTKATILFDTNGYLTDSQAQHRVDAIRAFNRFYTQRIGVLGEEYLESNFSLTQVRVFYELAHRKESTAAELGHDLGLDAGYLSRTLRDFEARGFLRKRPSRTDRRQTLLALTKQGHEAFAPLEARAREGIRNLLSGLSDERQRTLIQAMQTIDGVLGDASPSSPYVLRLHRPGDIGWVIHRHGSLYSQEYGWDERFEALVAKIAADFVQNYNPKYERCWLADRNGEIAGSVFLVRADEETARLRLLLVEPSARGLGIGAALVDECIRFARHTGYRKITLWTQSILQGARRIYERAGFRLVRKERHCSFGHALTGETWELDLN
jgi:DNA-binding MarR family transcriptional regulator/GNAT superfamily N-acetyltransferase